MNKTPKRIDFSKRFDRQFKKSPLEIKIAFRKRIKLFIQNPFDPQLRNHPLKGVLQGYKSINITGDWRALYSELKEKEEIIIVFEMLGKHSQLYR